jgi:DNA-directed RNA polymerase subunit RPC12/RpoP
MDKVSSKTRNCPECSANWVSSIIPKEQRKYYSPPYFFSRLIGIYSREHDRTIEYVCPDCGARFDR